MKAINLYLDCEFNGHRGSLISLALVSEDGREFYECLPCDDPEPWVAEHVIPVIDKAPTRNRIRFAEKLSAYLRSIGQSIVHADWPADIAYMCDAVIIGPGERVALPKLAFVLHPEWDTNASAVPHNALHDARALRDMAAACGAP